MSVTPSSISKNIVYHKTPIGYVYDTGAPQFVVRVNKTLDGVYADVLDLINRPDVPVTIILIEV